MSGSIKRLSAEVSNQIAAGEVVERPASVVKELVENSLDAGADRVEVEFVDGGISKIEIVDNGSGIDQQQLDLAIKKHTTSKITSAADLQELSTLGFRGEALASIASVAEIEIITRTANMRGAALLKKSPGEPEQIKPAGRRRGTTVKIENLFATIPARRKFLATQTTEKKHIIEAVQRKILAHPGVHFVLKEGDRVLLNVPAGPVRERVSATLGAEIIEHLIPLDRSEKSWKNLGNFELQGLISDGEAVHYSRRNQFLFVNSRPVRDPIFFRAISQAYRDLVLTDRHPVAVLFFNLPGSEVDVNVHPRKEEVRFNNSSAVYRFLNETITETLKRHYQNEVQGAVSREDIERSGLARGEWSDRSGEGANPFSRAAASEKRSQDDLFSFNSEDSQVESLVIGQFKRLFLLVERAGGLLFVDQHNAHEKILFERYLKRSGEQGSAQYLSVPIKLEVSSADRERLLEKQEKLAELGLEIESFGGTSMVIQSVPGFLGRRSTDKKVILEIIEEFLEREKEGAVSEPEKAMLAILACKGAIKRGELLMPREQEELVGGLNGLDFPKLCPHGRPVYYELKNQEMARWVGRPLSDLEPR